MSTCPHIHTNPEGTQWCELAEKRIRELEDQLRARQIDVNSAALSEAHKRIRELEEERDAEIAKAVREERERCARVCEAHRPVSREEAPRHWEAYRQTWGAMDGKLVRCAAAIRALEGE